MMPSRTTSSSITSEISSSKLGSIRDPSWGARIQRVASSPGRSSLDFTPLTSIRWSTKVSELQAAAYLGGLHHKIWFQQPFLKLPRTFFFFLLYSIAVPWFSNSLQVHGKAERIVALMQSFSGRMRRKMEKQMMMMMMMGNCGGAGAAANYHWPFNYQWQKTQG